MNHSSLPTIGLKTKLIFALVVLFILLGEFAFYVHMSRQANLFSDHFQPYELHVYRGASDHSALKEAYKKGNMDSVIWEFNSANAPQPEEYLLAGIAYLEKNQPAKAIETFKIMLQKNENSKTDFFQEDAEYYLAMSYLSNKESNKAMPIFEKIYADGENPYNSNVSDWFLQNVKTSIAQK